VLLLPHDNVQVVSRWVWPEKRTYDPATDAANDIDDIENSYMMISFTGQGGRGGRHVEFGLGLVMCTKMVIIGPKEHIFHELSKVKFGAPVLHFDTWTQFMNWFLDEELGV
jgi:hypothetical protein